MYYYYHHRFLPSWTDSIDDTDQCDKLGETIQEEPTIEVDEDGFSPQPNPGFPKYEVVVCSVLIGH